MEIKDQPGEIAAHIIGLEQAALERWGQGNPDAYLAITADDVSYFDPFLNRRLDGIDSLRKWYEVFRGKVRIAFDAISEPRVQMVGGAAVLSMQFLSHSRAGAARWNCTEVYEKRGEKWLIVHTHWAPVKPPVKIPQGWENNN